MERLLPSKTPANASDKNPRFPLLLILAAAVITVGLALLDSWIHHDDAAYFSDEVNLATKTSTIVERILHLDEVLTMSARMAAATGDKAWIQRYRQFERELDGLIKEAESFVPVKSASEGAFATDKANEELVRMEKTSFELVLQGKQDEALALLVSPEYTSKKKVYAAGMDAFLKDIETQRQYKFTSHKQRLLVSETARYTVTIFLIGLWSFALWRTMLTWRNRADQYKVLADSLQISEQRYRVLFESSQDALMTLAPPSWKFTSGNPAAVKMFSAKDIGDFTSPGLCDLSPQTQPDGRASEEKAKQMIETAMRDGSAFFEWTHKRLDGQEFPASVLLTRMEISGQAMLHATIRDITAQKRTENALRDSQEFMNKIINTIRDPIFVVNDQHRFALVNDAWNDMHGRLREEVLGRTVGEIFPSEIAGPLMETNQRVLSTGADEVTEERVPGDRGQALTVITKKSLYEGPSGKRHVVGIIRDITEQKRAEDEIRMAQAAAEQANIAKSEFLANMSHEIRTPMTAILGYAELSIKPGTSTSDRNNYLAIIHRNGEHLLELINDILDLSKIEAGKLIIEVRRVCLTSVLAEVASIMGARARMQGVDLSVEYATLLPANIPTDESRLRQILINLVGNAIKFTKRGSVRIVVTFLPQWRGGQSGVRIQVIDTGIGISSDSMMKIFQPFVQADASTSRNYGGSGLGLAISRRMAGLLGGELTAVSVPGEGSTFMLALPTGSLDNVEMLSTRAEAVQTEQMHSEYKAVAPNLLSGLRILLAEDGPDNQRLITTVLRNAGASVQIAENGNVALEMAHAAGRDGYHVILMDMQMPEMDGYRATQALRARGYAGPILALTAHAMSDDRAKCLSAGCNEHLTKPINRAYLVETVARFAGRLRDGEEAGSSETVNGKNDSSQFVVSQYVADPDLAGILDEFVQGLPDQIDAMRAALANNQTTELRRLAHQLKGAGGSYGYPSLTDAARILEDAANTDNRERPALAMEELTRLCEAVVAGHPACRP